MRQLHYVYSILMITGSSGVISVKVDVKGSVHYGKKLYEAVATVSSKDGERQEPSSHPLAKQRIAPDDIAITKKVRLRENL